MYIIEFAIRGSVTAVTSLWDCSLFFSLIGWPREPRPRIAVGHGGCIRPEGGHRPHLGLFGGLFETGASTGEVACVWACAGACGWHVNGM